MKVRVKCAPLLFFLSPSPAASLPADSSLAASEESFPACCMFLNHYKRIDRRCKAAGGKKGKPPERDGDHLQESLLQKLRI